MTYYKTPTFYLKFNSKMLAVTAGEKFSNILQQIQR